MAIKGSLREASLPDVLQLLSMGGKTGCLSVTDRHSFGYLYFREGRIIYASILNRSDRLGDILVRQGEISREQLEEAIEDQSRSRGERRLGQILIERGFIDQPTLRRFVRHQIEEAVYHLFTWSQGTFFFETGRLPEREQILVSIDPGSLLLEGARRVDEWSQIEKKVPSLELVFALNPDRVSSISSLSLSEEQEELLPYLDGEHSGWDIIDDTALSEFEVGKALYGLVSAGLARRVGRRGRRSGRAAARYRIDEHRNLGLAFYKTGMFEEAVREFKRVLELDSGALEAEFYLALVDLQRGNVDGAEIRLRSIYERGEKGPAVINNLAVMMGRLGHSAEAVSLLTQAISENGTHAELYLTRAILELRLADTDAARRSLDAYADLAGASPPAIYYSTRALAEAMSGNLDEASAIADEGLSRHPGSAALANNAGVILERRGEAEKARRLYEQALDHDARLPQVFKNLGDLLYREGVYDQAALAYERAVRADAEIGDDVYAKLGNVYYKSRARRKAIEMWVRALEINPANEVVRTNLEFARGASDGD